MANPSLQSLPEPLLLEVFLQLERTSSRSALSCLSKHFDRILRPLLYGSICVTDSVTLDLLCRTICDGGKQGAAGIGGMIESLVIDFDLDSTSASAGDCNDGQGRVGVDTGDAKSLVNAGECETATGDDDGEEEDEDGDVPTRTTLLSFFSSVPHLAHLFIKGSPRLASFVLSRQFAEDSLEGMVELEFERCFEVLTGAEGLQQKSRATDSIRSNGNAIVVENLQDEDRVDDRDSSIGKSLQRQGSATSLVDWFYYVELYPALIKLSVTVTSLPFADERDSALPAPLDPVLSDGNIDEDSIDDQGTIPGIHALSFRAPLSHPHAQSFLSAFTRLQFLSLEDLSPLLSSSSPVVDGLRSALSPIASTVRHFSLTSHHRSIIHAASGDKLRVSDADQQERMDSLTNLVNLDTITLSVPFVDSAAMIQQVMHDFPSVVELVLALPSPPSAHIRSVDSSTSAAHPSSSLLTASSAADFPGLLQDQGSEEDKLVLALSQLLSGGKKVRRLELRSRRPKEAGKSWTSILGVKATENLHDLADDEGILLQLT